MHNYADEKMHDDEDYYGECGFEDYEDDDYGME